MYWALDHGVVHIVGLASGSLIGEDFFTFRVLICYSGRMGGGSIRGMAWKVAFKKIYKRNSLKSTPSWW